MSPLNIRVNNHCSYLIMIIIFMELKEKNKIVIAENSQFNPFSVKMTGWILQTQKSKEMALITLI